MCVAGGLKQPHRSLGEDTLSPLEASVAHISVSHTGIPAAAPGRPVGFSLFTEKDTAVGEVRPGTW